MDKSAPTANVGPVWNPPPGYGMIPAWLAWKQPSANAILVYLHLALFGSFNTAEQVYQECRPSKRTLADGGKLRERNGYPGTGLSVSTITRALRELESLNAIVGTEVYGPNGAQLPDVYTVIYNNPHPHVTHDTGPRVMGDMPPRVMGDTQPRSTYTQNPKTQKTPPPACAQRSPACGSEGRSEEEEEGKVPKEKSKTEDAETIEVLVDAALDQHPSWNAEACRRALTEELAAGRDLLLVMHAWALCIADPQTKSPKRFQHRAPSCTWWAEAERITAGSKPNAPASTCETCAPYQRGFVYVGGDPDQMRRCPDCRT
jgi:hypothetical protein